MASQKVFIGADHAGFPLKEDLKVFLSGKGYDLTDVGNTVYDSKDDYPDYAIALAREVAKNEGSKGIIVCGSGVGANIAANKVPGARACLCHDTYSAGQGVEHDAMNVLCLGGRIVGIEIAKGLVIAFLEAKYSGEERHQRRLEKVLALEK